MKRISVAALIACSLLFTACNNHSKTLSNTSSAMREEFISYTTDSTTMNGYVVYDENIKGIRPAVLVVPEWWGVNDYSKMRAKKLAELGYIAMTVDIYGNGKIADNPDSAGAFAKPFYQNPQKATTRLEAAISKIRSYSQTDSANIAAVGYCFGGGVLLNAVRLGTNLKGIVSFHGSLLGTPLKKELLKSKILVCHGAADKFVLKEDVAMFKKQMDSIGAPYTFKEYANATHAFTNPNATAVGKKFNMPIEYNAAADTASWNDMKEFFSGLFK